MDVESHQVELCLYQVMAAEPLLVPLRFPQCLETPSEHLERHDVLFGGGIGIAFRFRMAPEERALVLDESLHEDHDDYPNEVEPRFCQGSPDTAVTMELSGPLGGRVLANDLALDVSLEDVLGR